MSHLGISHICWHACVFEMPILLNTFSQLEESLIGAGLTGHQIFVLQVYLPQVGTSELINAITANNALFGQPQ